MISKLSNISFKSTPLYDVKVKKRDGSFYLSTDAVFSRLNFDDEEDREALLKIKENWKDAKYCEKIVDNYMAGKNRFFYAIELKGEGELADRIVTLADVSKPFCKMSFLQFLQSKIPHGKKNDIKGGGEAMLYGIVRETKKRNLDKVELCANEESSKFYRHIGFEKESVFDPMELIMPREKFDSFLSRVEKKYGFSSGDNEQ